ncbi:hypothetical protein AB0O07_10490 [Streptomyces sp. NPDC093085]|uniref:hypothetical protein n=1 Tax=Streptomyces sp. NPDC093085 TaxID=3155068 RepID=UPI003442C456
MTMALVGMAVTAASGCVAVPPDPAREVRPAPQAAAPSPATGEAAAPIAQSPAKEALERIAPAPAGATGGAGPGGPDGAPAPGTGPAGTGPTRTGPTGRGTGTVRTPAAPAVPGHGPRPGTPRHPVPPPTPVPLPSVRSFSDLCALGERYGRWPADSPQARVCRGTQPD